MYQDISVSLFSNTYHQNFGQNAFWFLLYKKSKFSLIFILIALIISVIKNQSSIPNEVMALLDFLILISFIVAIIAFIVSYISTKIIHKNSGFIISEDAIKIRKGTFSREEFAIPYRQINNIQIVQSISNRMFGISKLIIVTGDNITRNNEKNESDKSDTNESKDTIFPVIDYDLAIKLRDELMKKITMQQVSEKISNTRV